MTKRGKVTSFLALTQISLIVLFVFSFTFIVSEINIVGAQGSEEELFDEIPPPEDPNAPPLGGLDDATAKAAPIGDGGLDKLATTPIPSDTGSIAKAAADAVGKGGAGGAPIDPVDPSSVDDIRGAQPGGPGSDDGGKGGTGGLGIGSLIGNIFSGKIITNTAYAAWNPLIAGVAWGGVVALGIQAVGGVLGVDNEILDALSLAAFIGSTAGGGTVSLLQALGVEKVFGLYSLNTAGIVVGVGVAVAVFLATYKKEKEKIVQYQCLPWEPPLGGSSCEVCNEDEFRPCSEYRCRSLGQACELVNSGTSEEKCVWVSPQDVTSPTITPWEETLTEGLRYTSHETRPPSLGTRVIRDAAADGCLQAFTPLEFGIETDEPAQCKIDYLHTDSLGDMTFFFGETNYYLEEHEQRLSLPSPDSLNAEAAAEGSPEFQNDGIYDLYVRCQDRNGNENVDEFVFSFCVDPSPDTTAPIIVDTSIISGSPVTFEADEVGLSAFINEPAECRWSIQDESYDTMENSFVCSTSVTEQNAQQLYECSTTLTGIKDREENKYYFRCKDQPSKPDNERNVNAESFAFTLSGTEPLNIINALPVNETISGSTSVVNVDIEVETSNGADEGQAICYFSDTGEEDTFIVMFETNDFAHKQTLTLPGGDYKYQIRCIDAGGNSDETTVSFDVFVDTEAPKITRAYKELDALKIITNEDAVCSYSLSSCNFNIEEGISLIYSNPDVKTNHFVEWQANIAYHIKCQDDFGNQPAPDQCSLIASATDIV